MRPSAEPILLAALVALAGCGDNLTATACEPEPFAAGDDGHPEPLAAGPGQARAGRVAAGDLPETPRGLADWKAGDFVLANDRIAIVVEDAGPSDHYDPWGGRIVGVARVEDGAMVDATDPVEMLVLTGRYSIVTRTVSVVSDGEGGGPAVVRAVGDPAPTPFFENIVGGLLREDFSDVPAAIEYVLEPDADYIDVFVIYHSRREREIVVPSQIHGFLYAERTPVYAPGTGFSGTVRRPPFIAFVDDRAASWAYEVPGQTLTAGLSVEGFASVFAGEHTIAACGTETRRHYARITVGGPGLDSLLSTVAASRGEDQHAITGVVRDEGGQPVAGARVHAESTASDYITRSNVTGTDGVYSLHVPAGAPVSLSAFVPGAALVFQAEVAADEASHDFALPATGHIHVAATDADEGRALPVRITVLPVVDAIPSVPARFGEPDPGLGRLAMVNAVSGDATIAVPAGGWRVVVTRGFEYELHDETIAVAGGATAEVTAVLPRVVDTTGKQCADYHIHTFASPDSPDDAHDKIRSAVADGVEIPVRSDHELIAPFQAIVDELGLSAWAFGVTSVELTSLQTWGHMGVVPLEVDPEAVNGGAPAWQTFPSADDPTAPVVTLSPPEVFDAVRARREQPIVIINHPRGGTNYFDYVGLDPMTGLVDSPADWDDEFRVIEVFNSSDWQSNRNGTVADWLGLLRSGRPMFAVGSSDSHRFSGTPVGYPRTCLALGTDDPLELTPQMVRDVTYAGHAVVSGGIYLDVDSAGGGPGDTVALGPSPTVHVRVQAATWIAVDWIEVIVDGELAEMIAVVPDDADPGNPAIRWEGDIPVAPGGGQGSFVIVAAYGDAPLAPLYPDKIPFGVANPIFFE